MHADRQLETIRRHFAASVIAAAQMDSQAIDAALFWAGDQWGIPATPEQIRSALDAFGFEIIRKPTIYADDKI